jgi:hypothetical protein
LFEKIEEAPCPASNVEKSQFALVPSGKNFMELRQRLPAGRVGSPVEEHLDLRVVSTRRIVRHPAACLEMEILQIVAGPLPAPPLSQDFVVRATLAALMDVGEILEKKPRAMEKCQQRSVMIGGKRVEAGLDISEVLLEKDGHIRLRSGTGKLVWARGRAFLPSRRARQLLAGYMKQRSVGEYTIEIAIRQIELEKILLPNFTAAVGTPMSAKCAAPSKPTAM